MKKWTIMAYLAGDNNLSEEMVASLKGMQAVGDSKNVALLALFDSINPLTPTSVYEFTAATVKGDLTTSEINDSTTQQFSKPAASKSDAIERFVKWAAARQPADNYVLILSGHGDGFQGKTLLLGKDAREPLTTRQLGKSLKNLSKSALRKNFAILGLDACTMSMTEVAFELRDSTDILVSSEGTVAQAGWFYQPMLQDFVASNGSKTAEEYAANFVSQYVAANYDYTFGGRSVDLSALNLARVESLVKQLANLADRLRLDFEPVEKSPQIDWEDDDKVSDNDATTRQTIKELLKRAILHAHWNAQTFMYEQAIDVRDFCEILAAECDYFLDALSAGKTDKNPLLVRLKTISQACQKVISETNNFVIKSCWAGADFQYSTGASLFFPWSQRSLAVTFERYKELKFASGAGQKWLSFLSRYLNETMRQARECEGIVTLDNPSANTKGFGRGNDDEYVRDFSKFKNISPEWKKCRCIA